METKELDYYLPQELIAQQPAKFRSDSRLLIYRRNNCRLTDERFSKISDFLLPGDCLVLNDTKVLPARFYARRATGAKLQGLFLSEQAPGVWEIMLKGLGKVKPSEDIILYDKSENQYCTGRMLEKKGGGKCLLKINSSSAFETILEKIGFAPLPPYIKRPVKNGLTDFDKNRYQTVYARTAGAVAAPTAGLHFTEKLMTQLERKGICFAYITLHVGAGTFKPVTARTLQGHKIHSETFNLDTENAGLINDTKQKSGRIIAVGTTSVRTLETAADGSSVKPGGGTTKLFIKPGYKFRITDGMVTNFHLPRSTLIALVGAFAGLENIMQAYKYAIGKKYRFYSYGDAMLIL